MESEKIIAQLRADLATENQEITTIIEMQEAFLKYLNQKLKENPQHKNLIKDIIKEFKKTLI